MSFVQDEAVQDAMGNALRLARVRSLLVDVMWEHDGLPEVSQHMTCSEAETMAEVLRVLDAPERAQDLLDAHAVADEVGDDHWTPAEGQCPQCAAMLAGGHFPACEVVAAAQ